MARGHVSIQRSIGRMTIDLHKAMTQHAHAADPYRLGERDLQFQFDFSGKIGTLPVEADITIPFDHVVLYDAGNARDSQLDRPNVKLSFEKLAGPAGIVAYGHVNQWRYDDDFNYVGAVVTVGVHCPAMLFGGAMPTSFDFHYILHASFQGYGAPTDADSQDGGGMLDPTIDDMGVG